MLKTKIFASDVNNLSDARYFAAWDVEHIGFKLGGSLSAESIKEMIDWVEGPTYVGEIDLIDSTPSIIDDIATIGFDQVSTSPFFTGFIPPAVHQIPTFIFNGESEIVSDGILKIETPYQELSEDQKQQLINLCSTNELWLEISFRPEEVKLLLEELKPYGLVIKGGDEEAPGIRSFDDLDLIFEELEIFV